MWLEKFYNFGHRLKNALDIEEEALEGPGADHQGNPGIKKIFFFAGKLWTNKRECFGFERPLYPCLFHAIGYFNEADTLESSSKLIYSDLETVLCTP